MQLIQIDNTQIQIKDHKPLIEANIIWEDGCDLQQFLNELNSRVFLWAGTERGPCKSGQNHIAKYQAEGEVRILRIPTDSLLQLNARNPVQVTFCNSGSARQNAGQKAMRGPSTFHWLERADRNPGEIVELTFKSEAKLPWETEYALSLSGPWLPLFADA